MTNITEFTTAPAATTATSTFDTAHPAPITAGGYPTPAQPSNPSPLRVFYGSLHTGELWGELPVAGPMTWTRTLSAAGGASIPIALDTELADQFKWRETAVWVEEHGRIQKGIIATALTGIDVAANRATLVGPGLYDYFNWRLVFRTRAFRSPATNIAEYYLRGPAAAIRMGLGAPAETGAQLAVTTEGSKFETVAKVVDDLAASANGFDHIDQYDRDDDGRPFAIWQPVSRTGRIRDVALEIGGNVQHAAGEVDASGTVDRVLAVGAANDDDTPTGLARIDRNADIPYTLRTAHTDTDDPTILRARADHDLARGSQPAIRPTVRLIPGALPADTWELGDLVDLRGGYGLYQPAGRYRIVATSTTASKGQTITDVSLAQAELFE